MRWLWQTTWTQCCWHCCAQALTWLTVKALQAPDAALTANELPPKPSSSSSSSPGGNEQGSADSSPAPAAAKNPKTKEQPIEIGPSQLAGDGQASTSSSQDQWPIQCIFVPPSPGGGVLGSGESGDVLAGVLAAWFVLVAFRIECSI